MRKISEFLKRFKKLEPSSSLIEKETRKIINKIIGIPKSQYSLIYKKPNLTITSYNSVLKNEIFLKQDKIIQELKRVFKKNSPIQIWFK